MSIATQYIDGLKQAYITNGAKDYWHKFESLVHGATQEDIDKLKIKYPLVPQSLIEVLEFVDGTYWREYDGKDLNFIFLGSSLGGYPYHINSTQQMIESDTKVEFLKDYINRDLDPEWGIPVDDKIIDNFDKVNWLHFSDCINNGGSSQLFIDFSPSDKGKVGQVVMYVHDPDELTMIADTFDDYLKMLIDNKYAFIGEDIVDDDDL